MKKKFDREPVCCGVCKREAQGLGYTPRCGAPIAWICSDATCISLGKTAYHMSERELTFHERASLDAAGGEAGAFLEHIGKTDLASLSGAEWATFLETILMGYEKNMRERLLNHVAPF